MLAPIANAFNAARADDSVWKTEKSQGGGTGPAPVYELGTDVSRPKLVHSVEPSFSTKPNEAFVEGTVTLSIVVDAHGLPTDLQVLKGLNAGQDRSAIDAVKQWRFQPGTRGGKAVNVRVNVQVDFHLL